MNRECGVESCDKDCELNECEQVCNTCADKHSKGSKLSS